MSYLSGKKLYLSGAIDRDLNPINWRPGVKKVLLEQFELEVFDPFFDPKQSKGPELKAAKASCNFDRVAEICKGFVRKDLSEVDRADILLARVDEDLPTVGTTEEIISAFNSKKLVLLICERGKQFIPSWFFGYIPHQNYMYGSFNELYSYLHSINLGLHKDDYRLARIYNLI